MKKVKYYKVKFINYFDVWGNKIDGYEVNNLCIEFDDLIIAEELYNGKDLIKYLYDIEFFNTHDMRKFIIEDMGELIEIYQKKDLFPLGRFEIIEEFDEWIE